VHDVGPESKGALEQCTDNQSNPPQQRENKGVSDQSNHSLLWASSRSKLTEGGEVLQVEGEGLDVGLALDGVVLVEPVRYSSRNRINSDGSSSSLLLGHNQQEAAAERFSSDWFGLI